MHTEWGNHASHHVTLHGEPLQATEEVAAARKDCMVLRCHSP